MLKDGRTRSRRFRAPSGRWRFGPPRIEILEPRQLLAQDVWTGAGDGKSWQDQNNWSLKAVPGPSDDATISAAANLTVLYSATASIRSLNDGAGLDIAGGSLTVTSGASQVSGSLMVAAGAVLSSSGSGTSFTATGSATIDGANLYASGGAVLAFPDVTEYAGTTAGFASNTLQASGTGAGNAPSRIDLSHATVLTGVTGNYGTVYIKALAGGEADLSEVASQPGGSLQFTADGAGSLIDLSALKALTSKTNTDSSLQASNGGTTTDPLLTTLSRTDLTTDATGSLGTSQITSFTAATITANGGSPDFSGLTSIDGLNLYANNGAVLAFPNLGSYAATTASFASNTIQASGTGTGGTPSRIDLSHATNLTGVTGNYGTLYVKALAGGKVNFSRVASDAGGSIQFTADGADSTIDLSALRALTSATNTDSSLQATNGGTITDPSLANLNRTDITTDGTGLLGTSRITSFTAATMTANGGAPDYSGLTSIDGDNLYANSGAVLAFPDVTEYAGATAGFASNTLQASGASADGAPSRIDLSHATVLTGVTGNYGTVYIKALAGGKVNLSNAASNPAGSIQFTADGAGSTINLSSLGAIASTTNTVSSLQASNNGQISLSAGTVGLTQVNVTSVSAGTITAGTLQLFPGSSLSGTSTIQANVINAGTTTPGSNGSGVLTIAGNFTQYGDGALDIQVGGLTAGSQFGQVAVGGAATLGGTLAVSLINGFTPQVGNSFPILTFGSQSGEFAAYSGLNFAAGQTFRTVYGTGNLSLAGALSDIRVFPTTGLITSKAGDPATFTVVLATQPSANVTLDLFST
jgi:hypothetical protein